MENSEKLNKSEATKKKEKKASMRHFFPLLNAISIYVVYILPRRVVFFSRCQKANDTRRLMGCDAGHVMAMAMSHRWA